MKFNENLYTNGRLRFDDMKEEVKIGLTSKSTKPKLVIKLWKAKILGVGLELHHCLYPGMS